MFYFRTRVSNHLFQNFHQIFANVNSYVKCLKHLHGVFQCSVAIHFSKFQTSDVFDFRVIDDLQAAFNACTIFI